MSAPAALLVLAATNFGCLIRECTEIGCNSGVRFEMVPPIETDGDATVEFSGDLALNCTQTVSPMIAGPCFDAGVTFEVEGQSSLRAISLTTRHPRTVSVRVLVGGVVQRELSTTVEYRDERPNGPDCPGCRAATVDVPAPAP